MRKPPYTERRGGQWQYRRRVPLDIAPILGFKEYRESLQTPDMEVARTRAALRNATVEVELQTARADLQRQQQAGKKATAAPADKLTPHALRFIRDAVVAHTLQADEEFRRSRPNEDSLIAHEDYMAERYEESGKSLALGVPFQSPEERGRVEQALRAVGMEVHPDSPDWQQAAFKATEGYHLAMQAIYRRGGGEYVPTPEAPAVPVLGSSAQAIGRGMPLGAVIETYVANIKQSGYTRKVKRCLQLFGKVIGTGTPVQDIKQKAVTAFLKDICKLPSNWAAQFDNGTPVAALMAGKHDELMSPTTYRDNYRAPLGAFLKDCKRDHGDDGFPELTVERIEYVGSRKANEDQQGALDGPTLRKLIEGTQFAAIAKDPAQESLYWFTVLSLFTGARPRELCQVNPQVDFGQLDGIWFVDLNPDSAAGDCIKKTIKTGEERRIPLHPELIRLGLPEYLERLKKAGADRLFPGFRVKKGNPFEAAGDLFSGLLRDVGIYDDTAPPGKRIQGAYVMRKTFITMCRNQGVVSKEITGHSDGTTTQIQDRHYIFGPEPLRGKNEQLCKLVVPVKIPQRVKP